MSDVPNFSPWMNPTPMQQAIGWLIWQPYRIMARLTPLRWLRITGWRGSFAVFVYSEAWFWEERSAGRA